MGEYLLCSLLFALSPLSLSLRLCSYCMNISESQESFSSLAERSNLGLRLEEISKSFTISSCLFARSPEEDCIAQKLLFHSSGDFREFTVMFSLHIIFI